MLPAVNLLLLLSALLSALSGVGQAVRGGRAPTAVCATVAPTRAAPVCRRSIAARPSVALPMASQASAAILTPIRLAPHQPIFAGRRRE